MTSRREFVRLAAASLSVAAKGYAKARTADEALHDLIAGNQRFAKGQVTGPRRGPDDFRALAEAQYPEAVIVSCSDSRVAPEILFDVGVGDIFVIRVAGNIIGGAGATVKGSIEYAIAELNAPLILVLGHSGCGAVKSAIKHIDEKDTLPGAIEGLVGLVKPAVIKSRASAGDPLENAIRANVELGVQRLQGLEPILAPRVKNGTVKIAGGVYDLKTGLVTLLN